MKLGLATLQMRFEDSQLSYFSFQKFSACKLQIFSKTAEKLINVGLSSRQVEWSRKFHQRARAVCESTESREKVAENWERQTFGKISFCRRIRARNPKIRLRSDSSLYLSLNHLKIYDEGQQRVICSVQIFLRFRVTFTFRMVSPFCLCSCHCLCLCHLLQFPR